MPALLPIVMHRLRLLLIYLFDVIISAPPSSRFDKDEMNKYRRPQHRKHKCEKNTMGLNEQIHLVDCSCIERGTGIVRTHIEDDHQFLGQFSADAREKGVHTN